jgi:hypothetical protein
MGVTMENGDYAFQIGTLHQPGVAPTFNTLINVTCDIKSFDEEVTSEKVRVSGACSIRNAYLPDEGTLVLEFLVPTTGEYFDDAASWAAGLRPVKRWCRWVRKVNSAMSAGTQKQGVVTKWQCMGSTGNATIEKVTIDLNPA